MICLLLCFLTASVVTAFFLLIDWIGGRREVTCVKCGDPARFETEYLCPNCGKELSARRGPSD